MSDGQRRVIEVGSAIVGGSKPRPRALRARKRSDYSGVPEVYLDVAEKLSSPLASGPPLCDELIEFVKHLFTEEEAAAARRLRAFFGRTAAQVARAEGRPVEEIEPVLVRLAFGKRAIAAVGPEDKRQYNLLPIMPGIFEMVLIGESLENLSPWHRRFAELFEALYETGYISQYQEGQTRPTPAIRVLPVGRVIEAHPAALPSDKLEVVLDRFETFGVGQCQCRTTQAVVGRGCGRPRGNCTAMGQWAEQGIEQGWLRRVSRNEVLEIKREAESHGLVSWIINVESTKGQVSCSCCGCCCHAFRTVSEFNVPGAVAPPHFVPRFDPAQCSFCGRCAASCPMGAIVVDPAAKTHQRRAERCIGCGLCAVACERRKAVAMEPVPDYRLPYRSWFSLLAHTAPSMLRGVWRAWRSRP